MEETTVEQPKKRGGWPKGKKRKALVAAPPITLAPEPEAPIHVRLRLKNYPEPIEFGCAERTIENGFHVFTYPSERDRYRMTRREFAISEIIEIEITAARHAVQISTPYEEPVHQAPPQIGPVIHSARKSAVATIERLASSNGPIKMDTMPNLTFGDHAG
jgi:hypothetical protein